MPHRILEVCVDSTASALAAKAGGADRLELCADLAIGGTTPSAALVRQVKAETGLPVRALLRPRAGDFCYDRWELSQMAALAAELVAAGADGILAFEGNPAFIAPEDIGKIDLFVLASEAAENAYEVRNIVLDAQDSGVPKEKMLLSADFGGAFYDSGNASADVLTSMADQTIILGPMAGLALYNIESDYYHYDGDSAGIPDRHSYASGGCSLPGFVRQV